MDREPVLQLTNVSKRFRNIQALNKVAITLYPGEVHALLGENGAGKSTVLNIMSGSVRPDEGEITYRGKRVHIDSPIDAKKLGIVKVHQELQFVPEMTVYENIFLGNELLRPVTRAVWYGKMEQEADKLLRSIEADFSSRRPMKDLSIARQQMVEIAKALHAESSLVILDEPTSSLTSKEIGELFLIVRKLKSEGKAVLFVSHRLEEVFEIADRITVFRDGCLIDSMPAEGVRREALIQKLTGRSIQTVFNTGSLESAEEVLSVRGLKDAKGKLAGIDFKLYRGEILGFAGLVGSGRTETMRAIFGADKKSSGTIELFGRKVEIRSARDSMRQGIALIPENRKEEGMVGILSNMYNVGLCSFNRLRRGPVLTDRRIRANAEQYMRTLNVRPFHPQLSTENLSGGNQQKIVIAKWLSTSPRILIMDEPTRGIDVGAKDEIYKLMMGLAKQGISIIMISSELPEILNLSNRIIVMCEGRVAAELNREEATEEKILHYAMGGTNREFEC